jgi:hypothetical protein
VCRGLLKLTQKSSPPESLGIHITNSLGKVRDFDQLFGGIRSMIEIAEEPPAADTNLRAVRSVVSLEE